MKDLAAPVAAAFANGFPPFERYEIYNVTLVNGTNFYWANSAKDITYGGHTYLAQNPFLKRSKWSVTNDMKVPSMTVTLLSMLDSFNGGLDVRSQIVQGLLDGAVIIMSYIFIDTTTGLVLGYPTLVFGGVVSTAQVKGPTAVIAVKGANNKLDQYAPRRTYQVSCSNTFCDSGCTLVRGSFTSSFVVDVGVTRFFIPWTAAPGTPSLFQLGTVTMTSGAASGESMNVDFADASGLTLSYPLYNTPAPGDTFDAFQGCDKTVATCTSRGNQQNGLWFLFVPPAETAL